MTMKRSPKLAIVIATAMMVVTAALAQEFGPGTFDLSWNTVDGGGGTSNGGTFELSGTIGQLDAGVVLIGGAFEVSGGFWPGGSQPVETCPADLAPLAGDGIVNVQDLLVVIGAWGACANPNDCLADISPPGGNDVVDVQDLLAVIGAWGMCP